MLKSMRIKRRFTFHQDEKKIFRFLDKHKIEYDHNDKSWSVAFELFEDQENFKLVDDFMSSKNRTGVATAVYTKDEVENAQWLTVRSTWRNLYPQPEENGGYKHTTYDSSCRCEGNPPILTLRNGTTHRELSNKNLPEHHCDKGLVQKNSFVLKKEPNWGSRNFLMIWWIWDEFFISLKAVEMLKNSDFTGFDFWDVLNTKGEAMSNTKQLLIKRYLDYGLHPISIQETFPCPICGFVKYFQKPGGNYFKKEIFDEVKEDIVKTSDKFGEIGCSSLILVTHKFYKAITEAKLDRGLIFEPVELV